MKIKLLDLKYNSTLSCILKSLKFLEMIHKKLILSLVALIFLGACAAPTAMLGPAYTLTSTGNVLQAGFSYGSSELVTYYTGKTPMENVIEMTSSDKDNIQKKTLESKDFKELVKNRIKKTNSILKTSNQ